jgi:hypothetical protein
LGVSWLAGTKFRVGKQFFSSPPLCSHKPWGLILEIQQLEHETIHSALFVPEGNAWNFVPFLPRAIMLYWNILHFYGMYDIIV